MIRDAELFSTKMSKIEGSGDLGEYIVDLVKSKPLPEAEVPSIPAPAAEPEGEEEKTEVMFDAADPLTPSTPTPTDGEKAKEQDVEGEDKKVEEAGDPPLPPTPEQMEEAERKKSQSGDSSPSTASKEAEFNGSEEANEALSKELPPTPMDVDGKEKEKRLEKSV